MNISSEFEEDNQAGDAILTAGIVVFALDSYVIEALMRDLVGHDRRPASFLVYLWFYAQQQMHKGPVEISYRDLAEAIGVSKSSAQAAVGWLVRRKLLAASKTKVTSIPRYTVMMPWRERERRMRG